MDYNMKNIFLDLGTHYGQGLREFIAKFNMDSSWLIYTFEANYITHKKFIDNYHKLTPYVYSFNYAVSDHDGKLVINIETPPGEDATGMGSSVISLDNWNPWGNGNRGYFKENAEVLCFDLSEFIKKVYNDGDKLIIKMDIEGSEYDVLEKMILDGTIKYIDHISVEWHSRFFNNKEEIEARENEILKYMHDNNIHIESWK